MKQLQHKSSVGLERVAVRVTRWIGSTNSILVHTVFFIVSFVLFFWGVPIDKILLVVTTLVSLEAIYLSIFIQMSMNRQARRLHAVAKDVEEIQEDVDEIQKDVDEIQEDVEEIQEDVDEIQKDVDEIQEDVEEIQEEDKVEEKDKAFEEEVKMLFFQSNKMDVWAKVLARAASMNKDAAHAARREREAKARRAKEIDEALTIFLLILVTTVVLGATGWFVYEALQQCAGNCAINKG